MSSDSDVSAEMTERRSEVPGSVGAFHRRISDSLIDDLSGEVRALLADQASLRARLGAIEDKVDGVSTALTRFLDAYAIDRRPPYQTIFAGAAIVLGIVGMFGSGYVRDLNRIEATVERNLVDFRGHVQDGHPTRVENKLDALAARLDKSEETLRREFETAKATRVDQIRALESKLGRIEERSEATRESLLKGITR